MTSFILKLIAMTTMVTDHAAVLFFGNNMVMRVIGRFSFLTYAFLMAESYCHLKDRPDRLRAHVIKLIVLAVVTEFFFDWCRLGIWLEFGDQNALFTLLLGFAALIACGWWKRKYGEKKGICAVGCLLSVLAASALSYCLRSEYTVAGILFIVLSYAYLEEADGWRLPKRLAVLLGIVVIYLFFLYGTYSGFKGREAFLRLAEKCRYWTVGSVPAMIPLALYNRKLGYHARWFMILYSCFYPLQFAVLGLIDHLA